MKAVSNQASEVQIILFQSVLRTRKMPQLEGSSGEYFTSKIGTLDWVSRMRYHRLMTGCARCMMNAGPICDQETPSRNGWAISTNFPMEKVTRLLASSRLMPRCQSTFIRTANHGYLAPDLRHIYFLARLPYNEKGKTNAINYAPPCNAAIPCP